MRDVGEVDLQRTPEQQAERPRRPMLPWVAGGVLAGAVIFAVYIVFWNPGGPSARPVAETEVTADPAKAHSAAALEQIDVPPLDQTDALVRRLVGMLSTHPRVAAWLATDDLIRNFVVAVEDVAAGSTPAKNLRALAPVGPFAVVGRGGELYADPRGYARYDALADAVASIDAAGAARVYATLKPRIEEAHRERGFQDASFDRTLQRAIGRLLDTPLPPSEIPVTRRVAGYAFADAEMEALSGAQKQLLRMGPRNAGIIQDKLREVRAALPVAER